jgi:dolichol-phosphate mannosyltransferase
LALAIRKISPYSFKVSCIIPVWREHIICKVLAKFDKPYVDEIILVVDESTPEMEKIIEMGRRRAVPPVTLIYNERRMGIGYAIREGLKYSLEKTYDVVVVMAGNGKDNPYEIPRLLKVIE